MFVTVLSIVLAALSPSGMMPSTAPVLLGGGGPDAYGYQYLDSDTTAPGAPTYDWVSISNVGTRITTLGDDNSAGPFSIGFEFPYYWYSVNSVIVGSNGYISFGDRTGSASPFAPVPGIQKPNNQLAALLSDLDCTAAGSPNGSVWYWSNGADSFIVEYDSIAFWTTGGNNSFQIILAKADSSITFQYKEQSGSPYNGWTDSTDQVGIENISGAIGLNYLSGSAPAGNVLHPDLALRFFPPESTALQIHDVGVRNAMNDRNGGMFAVNGRPLWFWAVVKNFGNQPEGAYKSYVRVQRTTGPVLFLDSLDATASDPSQVESLAFANAWWPSTNGVYLIKVITKLTGDMLASNDTATVELHVVTLPGMFTYDGGAASYPAIGWLGPGGMANRFVPPVYPCSISVIRQFMTSTSTVDVLLAVYDDDGPGGGPGTVLFGDTVTVTTSSTWCTDTLPAPVVIDDGAFFVGAYSWTTQDPSFGYDEGAPISFQGWENTGATWGMSRYASTRDVCANVVTASGLVGIAEWTNPTPAPTPARIEVNPNPFGGMTTIRLLNPTGLEKPIELYDATGSAVRTLGLCRNQAVLDGRSLSAGIYFARVVGSAAPVAKLIVTR